jgi:hypothetical protein
MLAAFPVLWPYAEGGFEVGRPINVPYDVHVWCVLQYPCKRFRHHSQFIFQVFGVLQKRQMCSSACLQVSKKVFFQHQDKFRSLTPKDLMIASGEESWKAPFSKPVIKAICGQLATVRAKVMGTDELRIRIRGQIKGMMIMKGPPSLWITINLSNTGDSIAQVFTGEKIDMDTFVKTSGPNSEQRSKNLAADPYAAAKFFHFIIAALLEELYGIKAYHHRHVQRTEGIFGKVASYIGTVEAQGRGSLHLHIVVWLCGALTHIQMKEALKSESFRLKVKGYIAANIRADLDGADGAAVCQMPRQSALSYSRPEDPRQPNYEQCAKGAELKLAKAVQHHICVEYSSYTSCEVWLYIYCSMPFYGNELSPLFTTYYRLRTSHVSSSFRS